MPTAAVRLPSFKAYDVRGIVPDELNEDLAYRIGRAYAEVIHPQKVAVGRDVRPSSEALAAALARGLNDGGVDVLDIGLCGTEQIYFATFHLGLDGGIMVTASHNPAEYNGMKFVREQAIPISGQSGLDAIEELARTERFATSAAKGTTRPFDITDAYIDHLMSYIHPEELKPFTIACNPGNGCAGPILKRIAERIPCRLVMKYEEPDGSFPNGVPNPLLPENRSATTEFVIEQNADFGIAWDGDFDRCFFFDERGEFIEGYYIVGLLARAMLRRHPGAKIVHDPRLVWNTVDIVSAMGGVPICSKTGHALIKETMRAEDAVYGGEMSAHHYFKSFGYCDSGMIPWLLVADILSREGKRLSELIAASAERYPVSGEINRKVDDAQAALARIEETYRQDAAKIDYIDGISMEFPTWRFNVRMSNTEPLLRLNVETRGDRALLAEKTQEILELIDRMAATR